jgi:colanic acid biosynthesis glycosyl transferase WcaI
MRIGLITQWYDPEVGSAAVPGSIARALVDLGHEVDVLTGFPNYPTGRTYPGYRVRPYQFEERDGVRVHRAPLYPSHDAHPLRRAANFLSFAVGATAVGLRALRGVDAVLVYSTPATVALPAQALQALRKVPYVLLVQDLWPQTVTASGFMEVSAARRVELLLHRYCDLTYARASAIAVTSPGMTDLIADRGVPREKLSVVSNWADESCFRPVPVPPRIPDGFEDLRPFTAMYAGNLGDVQGLEVVVEAAELLQDERDIGFVLVGGGVAEASLKVRVAERRLDNVRFVPPQPVERMADVLALGQVQLITLRDLPVFENVLPSKVQATLAAGRPVIGAVSGDAAAVIRAAGAGTVVAPGAARALADAVLEASRASAAELDARGTAGRAYYLAQLGRAAGARRLSDLLVDSVATARGSR